MRRRAIIASAVSAVSVVAIAVAVFAGSALGVRAAAPSSGLTPEVTVASHGFTPAIRDLPSAATAYRGSPDRPLRSPGQQAGSQQPDPIAQTSTGPNVATTSGLSFAGIGANSNTPANPCNCAPPDTNGAPGATQYVQIVNTAFAVYDKTTGAIAAGFPKAINTLYQGLGNVPCATNDDGDPVVAYDQAAGRWVIAQFSVTNGGSVGYFECVAVSTTSDATGSYNAYAFSYGATQFPDYPKLGVWPDAYYVTYNIFNNGQTFAGPKTCAMDRNAMINGTTATQVCFQLGTSVNSILPADLDGTIAPPAGAPNYQLSLGSNALNFFKFHVDFVNTANSTLTGPTSIPVASFSQACGGGTCIPQPNTKNQLDSLADRLMYRLAYRAFSDGHESLVVTHSVLVSGNRKSQVDGVRWYELRNPSAGTPTVFQQGTFSPDSTSRWMGSIAMDKLGNIALGYSKSSSSVVPSIAITGRVPTDSTGTMEAEQVVKTGGGSQTGTLHRWGDYSAMQVDPTDDCTFWYTTEYIPSNGSFNWSTWVTSFKMPGC